jgi:methionine aminopeptidase
MRELNNYYKEKLNASEAIWEIITTKNECICNYIPASSKTSYSKKNNVILPGLGKHILQQQQRGASSSRC